jgi:hypothetical protein
MTGPGTLTSYAQCLRVIGQQLDTVGITTFELEMERDDYTVRLEHGDAKSSEKGFLRNVAERLGAPAKTPKAMHFAASYLVWLDLQGKSRRSSAGGMPDPGKLSLNLRVVGHHLDRKSAGDFEISWGQDSIKVRYGEKQESFTIENLYDLGVHMYLRRSNRNR